MNTRYTYNEVPKKLGLQCLYAALGNAQSTWCSLWGHMIAANRCGKDTQKIHPQLLSYMYMYYAYFCLGKVYHYLLCVLNDAWFMRRCNIWLFYSLFINTAYMYTLTPEILVSYSTQALCLLEHWQIHSQVRLNLLNQAHTQAHFWQTKRCHI